MTESGGFDHKATMMAKVMDKIGELDRIVLKKTAPAKDVSARRGSRGMDLTCLPTHLHITDRLMDLHTKSQRVTVIKTGGAGAPESAAPGSPRGILSGQGGSSAADKKTIEKLQQKLEDSEAKRKAISEDCSAARKESVALKKEVETLKGEKEAATAALKQANGQQQSQNDDELARLRAALGELQAELASCQDMLEAETSRTLAAVKEITARGMNMKINSSSGQSSHGGNRGLSEEMKNALKLLDESITTREACLREEVVSMNTVKELLEGENSSLQVNMDMVNKDMMTIQSELEAMRVSYHTLHSETIGKEGAGARADKELKIANDKIIELQTELVNAARKTLELERLPPQLEQEETKRRKAEEDKITAESTLTELREELKQYKHLNESLKEKMREIAGAKDASSKDFLDSFEEVMQDEMLAMKGAFEAKLKCKTEEANAMSLRHRQEIQRLAANASPYTRPGA
jgi:chromosome segregation ATPase